MAERLRARTGRASGIQVAGPAPAYIARRADRWRCNVVFGATTPSPSSTAAGLAVVGGRRPGEPVVMR